MRRGFPSPCGKVRVRWCDWLRAIEVKRETNLSRVETFAKGAALMQFAFLLG
jgi:hypothetical protein